MKKIIVPTLLLATSLFTGCDDGKIYPEEVTTHDMFANLTVTLKGKEAWPQKDLIVLAAFGDDQTIPISTTVIPEPTASNNTASVKLGLTGNEKTIAVSIVTKGTTRQVLYNFYTYPIEEFSKEINLPVNEIDLASFERIQKQIFNDNCVACHGGSTHAAAGLYLTDGKSYDAIVNVPADLSSEGKMIVNPGKPNASFITDILLEDIVNYNHSDIFASTPEFITLMKTWISEGAKNE